MNKNHKFGDGLVSAAEKYSQYDRRMCHTFSLGLLKLLLSAAKIEITIHQMKYKSLVNEIAKKWTERLDIVRRIFYYSDRFIVRQYETIV